MSIFLTLLRRELAAFFVSVTGYVIIAAVTLLVGASFIMLITNLSSETISMPVTELFFNSFLFWMIVILVTPVITMRLFALEKASGTYETLMTTPVKDIQVVASKFAAALIFYLIMWLPALVSLYVVARFTHQMNVLDKGLICSTYAGILLSGCLFISIGCFTSSLTRSQVSAAMMSLAIGVILLIIAFLPQAVPATDQWQMQSWFFYFDLFKQIDNFTRGIVDSRAVIFYVSATFLFLFLALRAVESRRWK